MATGRWTPDACSSLEDQEQNLSATQGATFVTENAGLSNVRLMSDGFPPVVRDRLLAMLVSASDSRDNLRISSAFPSCDTLGLLFKEFLEWHVQQDDTWIHIPSFKIGEVPIELVAAIVAAGAARSSNRAVQKLGLAIHELLVVQLRNISRVSSTLTREPRFLQAYALQIQIGLWSGDRRMIEVAGGALGNLVNMLRGGGRYRRLTYAWISPLPDDDEVSLEAQWLKWVEQESFTRYPKTKIK